jgi:plastocyanin
MPVNDIITQAEYNNIRNKVISVLGTGSGNSGYGQPLNSSAVAEGTRVTINEYANLRFDIINAWVHQVGSAPSTVTVAVGNTVRFSAIDAPVTTYDALANTLIANRFNVGAGQSAVAVPASSPRTRTWTGTGGDVWNSSISCTIDVQWPSANAARFFLTAADRFELPVQDLEVVSTTQNTQWTSILSSAGTQSFGGNRYLAYGRPTGTHLLMLFNNTILFLDQVLTDQTHIIYKPESLILQIILVVLQPTVNFVYCLLTIM